MDKVVFSNVYKLKKGTNTEEFVQAYEALTQGFIAKQAGFVSSQIMSDDDVWSDVIVFESMDALKQFEENSAQSNELALKFYSYLNINSCRMNRFTVEKTF